MLDKSKSSVQDTKSTRNRTSMSTNRNSVRIPSLFTHIELKVPSGSVLTTRASLAHRTEGSVGQHFRTELSECLSVEQIQCSNQNTNRTCLP